MNTETYLITNEQEFIALIHKLTTADNIDSEEFTFPDIQFKGFPTLKFNVKGEHYSSTLTTFLLKALNSLTLEIQRTYCLLKYGTVNLQRLTTEDYQNIDIIFKIREGSSEGESDNSAIAQSIIGLIDRGMQNMNGWAKLAIFLAAIIASGYVVNQHLENQHLEKMAEIESTNKAVDNISHLVAETLKLVKEKGANPLAEEIAQHTKSAQHAFLKEIAKDNFAQSAEINGKKANREQLNEYKKRTPIARDKETRTHDFLIKAMDFYAPAYINTEVTISVIRLADNAEFNLKTSLDLMNEQEINKLKSALGTDENVKIKYEEIKESGKIVQSLFIKIEFEPTPNNATAN